MLLISLVMEALGKRLNVLRDIPADMVEPYGWPTFLVGFFMEMLFFVFIPTIAYSSLYLIIPLSGVRTGLAGALLAFTLGVIPALMIFSLRIRLSMLYVLFYLLSILLKLGGCLAIIGYVYAL